MAGVCGGVQAAMAVVGRSSSSGNSNLTQKRGHQSNAIPLWHRLNLRTQNSRVICTCTAGHRMHSALPLTKSQDNLLQHPRSCLDLATELRSLPSASWLRAAHSWWCWPASNNTSQLHASATCCVCCPACFVWETKEHAGAREICAHTVPSTPLRLYRGTQPPGRREPTTHTHATHACKRPMRWCACTTSRSMIYFHPTQHGLL